MTTVPTTVNNKPTTPLSSTTETGTACLADDQAGVGQHDKTITGLLHLAVRRGDLERVGTLLDNGARPHCKGSTGFLPIDIALDGAGETWNSKMIVSEMVALLLSKEKLPAGYRDPNGRTPLNRAAVANLPEAVDYILARTEVPKSIPYNVPDFTDLDGNTALYEASERNHCDVIRVLLQHCAGIGLLASSTRNQRILACKASQEGWTCNEGWSALQAAAGLGHFDALEVLLLEDRSRRAACSYLELEMLRCELYSNIERKTALSIIGEYYGAYYPMLSLQDGVKKDRALFRQIENLDKKTRSYMSYHPVLRRKMKKDGLARSPCGREQQMRERETKMRLEHCQRMVEETLSMTDRLSREIQALKNENYRELMKALSKEGDTAPLPTMGTPEQGEDSSLGSFLFTSMDSLADMSMELEGELEMAPPRVGAMAGWEIYAREEDMSESEDSDFMTFRLGTPPPGLPELSFPKRKMCTVTDPALGDRRGGRVRQAGEDGPHRAPISPLNKGGQQSQAHLVPSAHLVPLSLPEQDRINGGNVSTAMQINTATPLPTNTLDQTGKTNKSPEFLPTASPEAEAPPAPRKRSASSEAGRSIRKRTYTEIEEEKIGGRSCKRARNGSLLG